MNKKQVTERLAMLTDPSKVTRSDFDDEKLIEEATQWHEFHQLSFGKTKMNVNAFLPNVIKSSVANIVRLKFNYLKDRSLKFAFRYFEDVKVIDSIMNSAYIHMYAKFTPAEFETFIKPSFEKRKTELLAIHAQFKNLDWFWNEGIYCSVATLFGQYHIMSYHPHENQCMTIRIPGTRF